MIKELEFVADETGVHATTVLVRYTIIGHGCGVAWQTLTTSGFTPATGIDNAKFVANEHWRKLLNSTALEVNEKFIQWCNSCDIYAPNQLSQELETWAQEARDGRI